MRRLLLAGVLTVLAVLPQGAASQTPFTWTLEAEQFPTKTLATVVPGGVRLSGAMTASKQPKITTPITFPRFGTYVVEVVARGEYTDAGARPRLGIFTVRGYAPATVTVTRTTDTTYTAEVSHVPAERVADVAFGLLNGAATADAPALVLDRVTIREKPPTAAGVTVLRGPLVQNPHASDREAVLLWWTDRPTTSVVRVGLAGGAVEQMVAVTGARQRHEVTLTGLTPSTRYAYRVMDGDRVLAEGGFTTLAPAGAPAQVTWTAVGDFGRPLTDGNTGRQAQLVAQAIAAEAKAGALSFALGDAAYPNLHPFTLDRAWLDHYRLAYAENYAFAVYGNHDTFGSGVPRTMVRVFAPPTPAAFETYRHYFHTIVSGPVTFLQLHGAWPEPTHPQTAWLRRELAAAQARGGWIVVHLHDNFVGGDQVAQGNAGVRQHLGPLFEEYGVTVVLVADTHTYARSRYIDEAPVDGRGYYVVISGAGARPADVASVTTDTTNPDLIRKSRGGFYVKGTATATALTLEGIGVDLRDGRRRVLDAFTVTTP